MPQNHPRIVCPYASEPERDERGPMRSQCVNGKIVHFITGAEMNCHLCGGVGSIRDPASYVCNACGDSMLPVFPDWWLKRNIKDVTNCFPLGLVDAQVHGGYDSHHLFDLTTYQWSMCEKCLRAMFNGFKVPPHVSDFHAGSESYEDDRKYWEFRCWKDSGEALAWARSGRCNGVLKCPNATTHRQYNSAAISAEESRCDDHEDVGLALNVESVSFLDVPALTQVRFFDLDEFDFDARTYAWTLEERVAIAAGARVFLRKNERRMAEYRAVKDDEEP